MLEGHDRGRLHCTRSVVADGGDGLVLNVSAEPAISGAGYRQISPDKASLTLGTVPNTFPEFTEYLTLFVISVL